MTQATARNNTIVAVFPNYVEIRTGWQSQNVESFNLREISVVATKGLVNATLKIETNKGRVLELTRMAPPRRPPGQERHRVPETPGRPLRVTPYPASPLK